MKKELISILLCGLTVLSIGSFNFVEANAEWRKDNIGWWYKDGSSYYTGWKLIDKNWYYFYSNGYMATNDNIDGYFVNSNGAWTNEISAQEARQLIINEDGNFLDKNSKEGFILSDFYKEYGSEYVQGFRENWFIPEEPVYEFYLYCLDTNNEKDFDICIYLVGKESKNVYAMPNQGGMNAYQIQDNKKAKVIYWLGKERGCSWH